MFECEPFQDFEAELRLAVATPRSKQLPSGMSALSKGEPQAGLDGLDVGPVPDPGLAGGFAADRVDSTDDLAFLVGCHCRLARRALHSTTPLNSLQATAYRHVVHKDACH